MSNNNQTVRWRATVIAGPTGHPTVVLDDWSLSTEDGEILARVFKSRTHSSRYLGAVCLGRASITGDIILSSLPSRAMAMKACEGRLATIAKMLVARAH
jgi:hypothetical protein